MPPCAITPGPNRSAAVCLQAGCGLLKPQIKIIPIIRSISGGRARDTTPLPVSARPGLAGWEPGVRGEARFGERDGEASRRSGCQLRSARLSGTGMRRPSLL